jgi:hypothetical protein
MSTIHIIGSNSSHDKNYKICDASGGLDVTRPVSTNARNFFQSAIADVEQMREYATEMSLAGNWTSDFASFEAMSQTLDWKARNLTRGTTTVQAGLGHTDDRPNRRIDRFVPVDCTPAVGDAYNEFAFFDSLSPLLPWIVDSKARESAWSLDHQNGRSEGDGKEPFKFESLYVAAWIVTPQDTAIYYPPLRVYGHPLTQGDVFGPQPDMNETGLIKPASPKSNPGRTALFSEP